MIGKSESKQHSTEIHACVEALNSRSVDVAETRKAREPKLCSQLRNITQVRPSSWCVWCVCDG